MKLDKVRYEKSAFKVPTLAAASHKFPVYPPRNSHFLTKMGKKYCRHKLDGISGVHDKKKVR